MTWNPITNPVNFIRLSGQKSPGIADVAGAGSPRLWDKRQGYGLHGSVIVFRGVDLSEFTVTLRLYTEADWSDWHKWRALVEKPPSRRYPRALDIWHPFLEMLGIKAVAVKNVGQPVDNGNGEWAIPITFLQYRRPKPALVKPEGAKAKSTDPVDQTIEALTLQLGDLTND